MDNAIIQIRCLKISGPDIDASYINDNILKSGKMLKYSLAERENIAEKTAMEEKQKDKLSTDPLQKIAPVGRPLRMAFTTIGCKLNQFETAAMENQFSENDVCVVPFEEEADVYVINTCTVTGKSDYRSRQAIRQAVRRNRNAFVVAAGCYSQVDPCSVAGIQGVDLILGNQEKLRLKELLTALRKDGQPAVIVGDIGACSTFQSISIDRFPGYTRAFIKVQDGCNFRCSYCLVSTVRGPNRSEAPERVLQQAEKLARAGYRELVLTGVHLGAYGHELSKGINLAALLKLLQRVDGIERIRLSSIEPLEVTDELIETMAACSKICHHLHIPLQSGDDWVLRRMNRNYDSAYYENLVHKITCLMPDAGIGADVMVGFPGETDERFKSSRHFIERLPLSYMHVFSFSLRRGTPAASFPHQVDGETKRERSQRLRALGRSKSTLFREKHKGKEAVVLVESTRDRETNLLKGLTDNYIQVLLEGDDELANQFVHVTLVELLNKGMLGVPVRTER